MSISHTTRLVVLVLVLQGLAGCRESSRFEPSPIPDPGRPAVVVPAALDAASISPTSGPAGRGTPVEILGAGFQPGVSVRFGAAPAGDVRAIDDGTIWATTPLGDAGTVDVVVTNPGGNRATLTAAYTYVAIPLPTQTSMEQGRR